MADDSYSSDASAVSDVEYETESEGSGEFSEEPYIEENDFWSDIILEHGAVDYPFMSLLDFMVLMSQEAPMPVYSSVDLPNNSDELLDHVEMVLEGVIANFPDPRYPFPQDEDYLEQLFSFFDDDDDDDDDITRSESGSNYDEESDGSSDDLDG